MLRLPDKQYRFVQQHHYNLSTDKKWLERVTAPVEEWYACRQLKKGPPFRAALLNETWEGRM